MSDIVVDRNADIEATVRYVTEWFHVLVDRIRTGEVTSCVLYAEGDHEKQRMFRTLNDADHPLTVVKAGLMAHMDTAIEHCKKGMQ